MTYNIILSYLFVFFFGFPNANIEAPIEKEAINFTYKNQLDKTVSLEDLRGSYVYIDLWATWCRPCLAQIPHLNRISKATKDSNIKYVSISLDEIGKKNHWKAMVDRKNMEGIQLFEGQNGASPFVSSLRVNYIPRFVLIDPEGNYITKNAPAPNDPRLKKLFKKLKLIS